MQYCSHRSGRIRLWSVHYSEIIQWCYKHNQLCIRKHWIQLFHSILKHASVTGLTACITGNAWMDILFLAAWNTWISCPFSCAPRINSSISSAEVPFTCGTSVDNKYVHLLFSFSSLLCMIPTSCPSGNCKSVKGYPNRYSTTKDCTWSSHVTIIETTDIVI